jgi:hypothetical protein
VVQHPCGFFAWVIQGPNTWLSNTPDPAETLPAVHLTSQLRHSTASSVTLQLSSRLLSKHLLQCCMAVECNMLLIHMAFAVSMPNLQMLSKP